MTDEFDFDKFHSYCFKHLHSIEKSEKCGCFYCQAIFSPGKIVEWVDANDEGVGMTAMCPKCGMDTVIGDHDVNPITKRFLKKMKDHFFNFDDDENDFGPDE